MGTKTSIGDRLARQEERDRRQARGDFVLRFIRIIIRAIGLCLGIITTKVITQENDHKECWASNASFLPYHFNLVPGSQSNLTVSFANI
jgi:hypothetical protein